MGTRAEIDVKDFLDIFISGLLIIVGLGLVTAGLTKWAGANVTLAGIVLVALGLLVRWLASKL